MTLPVGRRATFGDPWDSDDTLRLANYYQSLLDSGQFECKADMARHLGVSRARVTQVLNRLSTENENDETTSIGTDQMPLDIAAG